MTYSGMLVALTLFFIVQAMDERKLLWIAAAALGWLALVLTFTRGAWIGWLAGAAVIIALRQKRWFAYAIPLLLLLIVISPMSVFSRLYSSFDTKQSSNFDRLRMVQAGAEMIRDHPLTGLGPSAIKETYPLYRSPDAPRFKIPHLHNNVVQIWAERGILSLGGYLFLFALLMYLCLKARHRAGARTAADAGVAIAVAMFIAGLFEFNFGDTEVTLTVLDLFALVAASIQVGSGLTEEATNFPETGSVRENSRNPGRPDASYTVTFTS
jgi:O-antigen ligase